MSPAEVCQTPLRDLLVAIPADARLLYEHSQIEHSFFPVGLLAAQAVNELDALRARCEAGEALLRRCAEPLSWYADYLNNAPIWHATGHEANVVNQLLPAIDAYLKGAGRE